MKRTFTQEQLEALLAGTWGRVVRDEVVYEYDYPRSTTHRLIFRPDDEDKLYEGRYMVSSWKPPFTYEEERECVVVEACMRLTCEYLPVASAS